MPMCQNPSHIQHQQNYRALHFEYCFWTMLCSCCRAQVAVHLNKLTLLLAIVLQWISDNKQGRHVYSFNRLTATLWPQSQRFVSSLCDMFRLPDQNKAFLEFYKSKTSALIPLVCRTYEVRRFGNPNGLHHSQMTTFQTNHRFNYPKRRPWRAAECNATL